MAHRVWFPILFLAGGLLAGASAEIPPESQLELARIDFLSRGVDAEIFLAHLLRTLELDPSQGRKLLEHLVKIERAADEGAVAGAGKLEQYLTAKRQLRDVILLEDVTDPGKADVPMSRVITSALAWRSQLERAEQLRGAAVDELENLLSDLQKQALGTASMDRYLHALGITSWELEECAEYLLQASEHTGAELISWTQALLEQNGQRPSPENLENVQSVFREFEKLSEAERGSFLTTFARELQGSLHPASTESAAATVPLTGAELHNAVRSNIEQYLLDIRMIPVLQRRLEQTPPSPAPGN